MEADDARLTPWVRWLAIAAYFGIALSVVVEGFVLPDSTSLTMGVSMIVAGVACFVIGWARMSQATETTVKTGGQLIGWFIVLVFVLFVVATLLMLVSKVVGFAWS